MTLEDEKEIEHNYRIVGPDEFDQKKEYISIDSPMARALLKKSKEDEVKITLPGGVQIFYILDVCYQNSE